MKNILKFPKKTFTEKSNNYLKDSKIKMSKSYEQNLSLFHTKKRQNKNKNIPSNEENANFFKLLKKWPCFNYLDQNISFEILLENYYDNNLNSAQNHVIEYLFHIHDAKSPFDIIGSLNAWGEADRNFFILSLNMQSELIDIMGK